jgi:Zn finger protein HypA/HybF involved in hydrogenase expression
MNNPDIPQGKLCDSGCGQLAQYFSKDTGRYRCLKSANSCPTNKVKNSNGLKKAHAEGKMPVFTNEMREKSHISHRRKLVEDKPFEELGHILRKKIVIEEQNYKCSHCNLDQWMGLRITLELDHVDGNRYNNVRSNLRCLCPNCHSITDTWKVGQRIGKQVRKCSDEKIISAYENNSGNMNATLKELGYNWGSAKTVKRVLFRYKLIESI